ncbi:MAG: hypothetical protein J0M19_14235 [Sphingomonadales bacterium]|nr:hypothetical protein [Sphingomonadales bacterium]
MTLPGSLARTSLLQLVLLLTVALILRCDTFGDPNIGGDEVFYHQVGLAMHHGAWPYVDVWDRKPFGLFALYYLISAISDAPIAYQIAATLFAALTALVISLIAARWTGQRGALLAGISYLLWLGPLQGFGGQSPVFYNLFIASAALLVFTALPELRRGQVPRRVLVAMLLCGCAISIKTSAFAEAVFIGLVAWHALFRSKCSRRLAFATGLIWMAIGAAPTVGIALTYWVHGSWHEFWHAMVTANLDKPVDWHTAGLRILLMFISLSPVVIIAALGLLEQQRGPRLIILAWLAAALAGLAAVPNFYIHYALPLLVPMCVAASAFLDRPKLGPASLIVLAILSITIAPIFQFQHTRQSRAAIAALTQTVNAAVGDGPLLIYDGPPQIYQTSGQPFITPLVFPTHLSQLIERDVSHLSTLSETERVLSLNPGAVVMALRPRNAPSNSATRNRVLAYVGTNCRLVSVIDVPERLRHDLIAVWGYCRKPGL